MYSVKFLLCGRLHAVVERIRDLGQKGLGMNPTLFICLYFHLPLIDLEAEQVISLKLMLKLQLQG